MHHVQKRPRHHGDPSRGSLSWPALPSPQFGGPGSSAPESLSDDLYLTTRPAAKQEDYLFPSKTNRRLDRNNLRETIQRIAERAGVSGVTIHRFRHTFAINFLRNGGSVLELQEMLGHEKMETVRIYAKLAEVDLAAAQRRSSVADNWRL